MKIYAAADIHGSQYRLNMILSQIEAYSPDLVVICGDITQFGPGEVAKNFLNQIPVDTIAIPGNIDTADVSKSIDESKAENIHWKKISKHGFSFVGLGGELSSDLSNVVVKKDGSEIPIDEALDGNTILVTHVPPYKTQDKVFIGRYIGNEGLRALVDKCKPRLVLCGHVHEDPGIRKLKHTTVVNSSIGKRTAGALVRLDDKIDVEILD